MDATQNADEAAAVAAARPRTLRQHRGTGYYPVTIGGFVVGHVQATHASRVTYWEAFDEHGSRVGPVFSTADHEGRRDAVEALARTPEAVATYRAAALEGTFGDPERARVLATIEPEPEPEWTAETAQAARYTARATSRPRDRAAIQLGYACEYARRAVVTDGGGIGHRRIQVPGYQVSVAITPYRPAWPRRAYHVDLFDALTDDYVQYTDTQSPEDVERDGRTLLARYLAAWCGAPCP